MKNAVTIMVACVNRIVDEGFLLAPLDCDPDNSAVHPGAVEDCLDGLDNGCNGLAVLGTTGEANSFSIDERLVILDALAEAGITGTELIPGTGCCALTDTVRLSRRALEIGAAGVLMLG